MCHFLIYFDWLLPRTAFIEYFFFFFTRQINTIRCTQLLAAYLWFIDWTFLFFFSFSVSKWTCWTQLAAANALVLSYFMQRIPWPWMWILKDWSYDTQSFQHLLLIGKIEHPWNFTKNPLFSFRTHDWLNSKRSFRMRHFDASVLQPDSKVDFNGSIWSIREVKMLYLKGWNAINAFR